MSDTPTIQHESRRTARWITIKVEGRLAPVVDISDFGFEEAHKILESAADELNGYIESPVIMADGMIVTPSYTTLADIGDEDDD